MHYPTAKRFWRSTLPLCALLTLTACASAPQVVYRDRIVEVPTPVRAPLPANLTADCAPAVTVVPAGTMPLAAVLTRLTAVEDALLACRLQLKAIREI